VMTDRYRSMKTFDLINFRSRLLDIIAAAGLKPWPKLFQNMRSTRQTELSELFPSHVVCGWLGNSRVVAEKHYLQTTEEHFAKAIEEAVQNPVQQPAASVRNTPQFPEKYEALRGVAIVSVAEAGLERTANSSGNTGYSEKGGAESGASSGNSAPIDPDLMAIVNAWPDLPKTARQAILAIIQEGR
jgi:hypothetical protein